MPQCAGQMWDRSTPSTSVRAVHTSPDVSQKEGSGIPVQLYRDHSGSRGGVVLGNSSVAFAFACAMSAGLRPVHVRLHSCGQIWATLTVCSTPVAELRRSPVQYGSNSARFVAHTSMSMP